MPPAEGATTTVNNRTSLEAAVSGASPGDEIIIADGVWANERIVLDGNGSAQAPILVRAETLGGVVLTGQSSLESRGSYTVVQGLHFRDGYLDSGHVVRLRGSNNIVRETYIDHYNNPNRETRYFWVSLSGTRHTVEDCTFRGMNHSGVTVVVWRDSAAADYATIRRNHFVDRPQGTGNGWETIRIGTSGSSLSDSYSVVEDNLFERCDGEVEIISNKSGRNIYRRNTFRASKGCLTLRHGDNCTVDSNFFLGENVSSTGGIRVIGEGHLVVNNYIEATDERGGAAIAVNSGIPNGELHEYFAAHRSVVIFNTIVGVTGPHIHLADGYGSGSRSVLPEDVVIANNLMEAGSETGGSLVSGTVGPGLVAEGNIGHGRSRGTLPASGIDLADPHLDREEDALWRPGEESPVIGAAAGSYPQVEYDVDGQSRGVLKDVGADEYSEGAVLHRPLTPADVGASWARDPEISDPSILFWDTFDSRPAGNPPGAPWTSVAQTAARGSISLVTDDEDRFGGGTGNQVLEWRKDGTEDGIMRLDAIPAFGAFLDYRVLTFSFDHVVSAGSDEVKFFIFHDQDGTATSLSDPGENLVQRIRINDGRLGEDYVYESERLIRTDFIVNNSAEPISHNVRGQEYVVPAGHYQTWVNGSLAAVATARNNAQFDQPITHFRFESSSSTRSVAWFDDFSVHKGAWVRGAAFASFNLWRASYFSNEELDDETLSGPLADPVGDGVTNLLAYALGADPRTSARSFLPRTAIEAIDVDGTTRDYLTMTFERPSGPEDVSYAVKASSDLMEWADEAVSVSVSEAGEGRVIELWRDPEPVSAASRRALRLEVGLLTSRPPP